MKRVKVFSLSQLLLASVTMSQAFAYSEAGSADVLQATPQANQYIDRKGLPSDEPTPPGPGEKCRDQYVAWKDKEPSIAWSRENIWFNTGRINTYKSDLAALERAYTGKPKDDTYEERKAELERCIRVLSEAIKENEKEIAKIRELQTAYQLCIGWRVL